MHRALLHAITVLALLIGTLFAQTPTALNVEDYGPAGDGITDDTTEIQAAINDAIAQAKPLAFPIGSKIYKCGALTISGSVTLCSDVRATLLYSATTGDFITATTPGAVVLDGLMIQGPSSAGAATS